ncbi:MAG: DJ-1/PfpI family protein [Methanimicrococcus sp.]|nr:DJ-1/PfpI family protein [Methanimicrococcus sp.]
MTTKKILMIVAPERFRDEEFFHPREVFEKYGYSITVGSTQLGTAKGVQGGEVKVDVLIDKVSAVDFDAIVIAGGGGSKAYLWNNSVLHNLLNEMFSKNKIIAAICISPVVLAKAGLLKGKSSTIFNAPDAIEEMKKAGAVLVQKGVVVDGHIVTGNGPECAYEYGEAIVQLLK